MLIPLFDTSEDIEVCEREIGCAAGQLLTPLTRFRLQYPDNRPWAIDNGAFSRFDGDAFMALLNREKHHAQNALFVAAPDVVGSARRTLECFPYWRDIIKGFGFKVALVCQDGQQDLPIPDDIDAVFIGGSTEFKVGHHATHIIKAARILGRHVHIGRINDPQRWSYFDELADTCDGTGISMYSHMRLSISKRHDQSTLDI